MDFSRYTEAFPRHLAADVMAVAERLPRRGLLLSADDMDHVTVAGETLRIPYRVHHAQLTPPEEYALSPVQRLILAALYTRHHDGWVRESACQFLLASRASWAAPFLVQLLGEYVLPIVVRIDEGVTDDHQSMLLEFVRANGRYVGRTESRAATYWDRYHRRAYPRLSHYPAMRAVKRMQRWSRTGAAGAVA